MTRAHRLLLLGACGLALPLASPPLAGSAVQQPEPRNEIRYSSERTGDEKQTYEQLEILRRILSQRLAHHSGYTAIYSSPVANINTTPVGAAPSAPGADFTPVNTPQPGATNADSFWVNAQPNAGATTLYGQTPRGFRGYAYTGGLRQPEIDGVHLPGVGMIFTLRLAQSDQLARLGGAAAKPTDPWEAAAQDFRDPRKDDKPASASPPQTPPNPKDMLVERVLKTLGEFGHRLTSLPSEERIVVVVTLADHGQATVVSYSAADSSATLADPNAFRGIAVPAGAAPAGNPLVTSGSGSAPQSAPFSTALTVEPEDATARNDEAERLIKLGELHAKQGRYDSALDAYNQAIRAYQRNKDVRRQIDAYRRLAEVQVQGKRESEARDTLARIVELKNQMGSTTAAPPAMAPAKPQKLIVSIRVKDIRSAAENPAARVDVDTLKRLATIDVIDLPVARTPAPAANAPAPPSTMIPAPTSKPARP